MRKGIEFSVAKSLLLSACVAAATTSHAFEPYWTKAIVFPNGDDELQEFFDLEFEAALSCKEFWEKFKPTGDCYKGAGISRLSGAYMAVNMSLPGDPHSHSYRGLFCDPGKRYRDEAQDCVGWLDRFHHKPDVCQPRFGQPIFPLTGAKQVSVLLGQWLGEAVELHYDTSRVLPNDDPRLNFSPSAPPSFGLLWHTSMHKKLVVQGAGSQVAVQASRGGGGWVSFAKDGSGAYTADTDIADRLVSNGSYWRYFDARSRAIEDYDNTGRLFSVTYADGRKLTYTYSTAVVPGVSPQVGLLIAVTDRLGRSVQFNYDQPAGVAVPRVYRIIGPDSAIIQASYDAANNLAGITWQDDKSRRFLYERSDLSWALTGVKDENDALTAAYGYDPEGRANDTQTPGGIQHFHASWSSPPRWVVTETYDPVMKVIWRDHNWALPVGTQVKGPFGDTLALESVLVNGMPRQVRRSQPGGSGCSASSNELAYDSRGNITSEIDFGRNRACRAYDAARNVETVRVEGLSDSAADAHICQSDLMAYQVPAGQSQRKVTTEWHPLWKLETRRAEPKLITTTIYNGEKDPPITGTIVTCAETDPKLPDGSRITVVCRRYEQSTDDDTGNLGFAAPVKETRVWNYTYNQYGQVLTETDPRGKPTTYEYWAGTNFAGERGHWMGDLKKVTNALSQTTNHLEYNKLGQVLTTQYANGSQEQREYHVRGWPTKVTLMPAGGGVSQVTQYDYFDTGLLKKVTQPDGSYASYTWDDAHRLTDVTDSVGNKVHYELDNAGNRTAEKFKDPQGTLAKTITRTFDALGRMSSSTGLQ